MSEKYLVLKPTATKDKPAPAFSELLQFYSSNLPSGEFRQIHGALWPFERLYPRVG